jgi:hypothetical protein
MPSLACPCAGCCRQAEMARTLLSLARDDWPDIFHTLNSARRLARHHAPLVELHARELLRDVLRHVDNLRSQVIVQLALQLEVQF